MAQPNVPLVHINWGGAVGPGVWSAGVWFQVSDISVPALTVQSLVADALSSFAAFWTGAMAVLNSPATSYNTCTGYLYRPGQTAAAASHSATLQAPSFGTGTASSAASTSAVITLQTDTAGRSGRGRIYVPATAALAGLDDEYQLDHTRVTNAANAFAACLDSLKNGNESAFATPIPVVRSVTQTAAHTITSVRMDSRPDRVEHRETAIGYFAQSVTL